MSELWKKGKGRLMENFKVKAELEINVTQEDVDDIVATALEGGINY